MTPPSLSLTSPVLTQAALSCLLPLVNLFFTLIKKKDNLIANNCIIAYRIFPTQKFRSDICHLWATEQQPTWFPLARNAFLKFFFTRSTFTEFNLQKKITQYFQHSAEEYISWECFAHFALHERFFRKAQRLVLINMHSKIFGYQLYYPGLSFIGALHQFWHINSLWGVLLRRCHPGYLCSGYEGVKCWTEIPL